MASAYRKTLRQEFTEAESRMTWFHSHWNLLLDIAYARLSTKKGFKSRVREASLSSLIWERSARVVAQLPTGRIRALSQDNAGKSLLMDRMWTKYIMPGANTDYSFKIKLRLWDYYSLVYGAMPMFYDQRVDDEYIGPDAALLDPRYCFPAAGRTSLNSCRKVFVVTFHDPEWLEAKLQLKEWNAPAIKRVLAQFDEQQTPSSGTAQKTSLQEERQEDIHKGQIKLVTCYERGKNGRWVTFAPDYECDEDLRDIPNPHENGRIPVVFKYAMPLIDSIWGMGDVERGASLQRAIDTAINLGLDFSKFKIFPPMWYTGDVNKSQLRYEPDAKWKLPGPWGQSAGFVQAGGESSNEQQVVYQFLKSALLNQNGTTDTTISSENKMPGFGRTKQALEKIEKRENARDQWDRDMFEEAFTDLANGMINLAVTKQSTPIDFHIFDDDINELISAGYKDLLEIYDSAKSYHVENDQTIETINDRGEAKITIKPELLSGKYLFQIDPKSSAANDESEEFDRICSTIEFLATPIGKEMMAAAQNEGRKVNLGELLNQYFVVSGLRNRDKIYSPTPIAPTQQFDPSMINDPKLRAAAESMAVNNNAPAAINGATQGAY